MRLHQLPGIEVRKAVRLWGLADLLPLPLSWVHDQEAVCHLCHQPGPEIISVSLTGDWALLHEQDCRLDYILAHQETTAGMPFPCQFHFFGPLAYVFNVSYGIEVPHRELSALPHRHDPLSIRAGPCWASQALFEELKNPGGRK